MQEQKATSEQRLENAKERLKDALTNLDSLIRKQNERLKDEKAIRTEVIRDLDKYIDNLETILQNNG
jgi:flagellar biosynthesis chaperone FliJ